MRALLAAALLASLTALTGGAERRTPRGQSRDVAVSIRTFQFAPDTVRTRVGARLVWTNDDDIEHTITSGTPGGPLNGVLAGRGATFSARLDAPGTYRYFCNRHRFMNGTIIVTR